MSEQQSDLIEVRTTMRPWKPLRVDQAEYDDLRAQGLLLPGTEQHEIAEAVAASTEQTAPTAAKKKGPQA